MVGDLEVSPIYPPNRTVCPASPSLQWVAWASLPHLPRYCAPLRLPAVLLGPLRFRSLPNTLSAPLICVPARARWQPGALPQRQGSWSAGTPALPAVITRRRLALPSSRVPPVKTCPALRPRWCPAHSPRRTQDCCLPATENRQLTTTLSISGLHHAACLLATPGSVRPLTGRHAGSLLTCWLGFNQVGLAP